MKTGYFSITLLVVLVITIVSYYTFEHEHSKSVNSVKPLMIYYLSRDNKTYFISVDKIVSKDTTFIDISSTENGKKTLLRRISTFNEKIIE